MKEPLLWKERPKSDLSISGTSLLSDPTLFRAYSGVREMGSMRTLIGVSGESRKWVGLVSEAVDAKSRSSKAWVGDWVYI